MQYSGADAGPACELRTRKLWQSLADANVDPDGDSYSHGAFANTDSNSYCNGECDRTAAGFTDAAASADTAAACGQLLLQ